MNMAQSKSIHWRRIATTSVGVGLTALALAVACQHVDPVRLARADPAWLFAIALGVAGNILATGLVFWVVTRSFDASPKVGFGKMSLLISASALINYLPVPLPAGQVGRAAYLKVRNGLPLTQSFAIVMIVLVVSAAVMLVAGAVAAAPLDPVQRWTLGVAGIGALSALSGPVGRVVLKRPLWNAWAWAPSRALDLLVISARLWVAFQVVGQPAGFAQVVVAASAGMFVSLLPLTPNGLGLREWVVAGLTEAMAPTTGGAGLAASVIDRGVEAVVLTVAGSLAIWRLNLEKPAPDQVSESR